MHTQPATTIRAELAQLASFYQIPEIPFLAHPLVPSLLASYVELVLATDYFEVVLGGVGTESQLLELAQANHLPPAVLNAFAACVAAFPAKMLYLKLPVGAPAQAGSMYAVLLEPWGKVLPFLHQHFPAAAVDAMRAAAGLAEVVFILGFTQAADGQLLAKVYHLFDREAAVQPGKRFLISHRLTATGQPHAPKQYDARVQWADLATSARWQEICAFADGLFGSRYALLSGEGEPAARKAYVLRYDQRESTLFSHQTYNYYVEEGVRLVQEARHEAAQRSFRNALSFDPDDANAYNGLALANILTGHYLAAADCAIQARSLNPRISNYLWHTPVPGEAAAEIARLAAELAVAPSADLHNLRGVQYFNQKQYPEAIADFQRAIALQDLHADAYNNLAGAFLKTGRFADATKMSHVARSIAPGVGTTNWEIARQAMQLLRDLDRQPTADSLNHLGVLYYHLDLYDEARDCFVRAQQLPVATELAPAV